MDSNTALQELCHTEKAFGDLLLKGIGGRAYDSKWINASQTFRPLGFFLKVWKSGAGAGFLDRWYLEVMEKWKRIDWRIGVKKS